MKQKLASELRKILTVRSTYFISAAVIILTCLFTYLGTSREYVSPPEAQPPAEVAQPAETANGRTEKPPPEFQPQLTSKLGKDKLQQNLQGTISGISLFLAIVIILLMAHEYRYNTITYTLTLSNSRSRVLLAKILTAALYVSLLMLLAMVMTVAATHLAVNIKGLTMPIQNIDWPHLIGRSLYFSLGFALIGMAMISLLRNLTAGIVALFALPMVDNLASVVLRNYHIEPSKFLPFSALNRVMNDFNVGVTPASQASLTRAMVVFLVYLAGLWALAWYLFLRRDAT